MRTGVLPAVAAAVATVCLGVAAIEEAQAAPGLLWEARPASQPGLSIPKDRSAAALDSRGNVVLVATEDSCLVLLKLHGGDGSLAWRQRYCGSIGLAVTVDARDDIYAVGVGVFPGYVTTLKLNGADGALQWTRTYRMSAPATATPRSAEVALDRNGNAFVLGTFNGFRTALLKYSADGALLWDAALDWRGITIVVDSQGNPWIGGRDGEKSTSIGEVLKYTSGGALAWRRRIADGPSAALALAAGTDGTVVMTGYAGRTQFDPDMTTVKYSADGNEVWRKVETSATYQSAGQGVAIDAFGNVAAVGGVGGDVFTAKYRGTDGAMLWSARRDGPNHGDDVARHVAFDAQGDVYVAGFVERSYPFDGPLDADLIGLKYSGSSGTLLWSFMRDSALGSSTDRAEAVLALPGRAIFVGSSNAESARNETPYVAKYGEESAINGQGLWWAAPAGSESGWGLNFVLQGDVLFATWFTYDADGRPGWFVMPNLARTQTNGYAGRIYRTTGPYYGKVPFARADVVAQDMGEARISFHDADHASFVHALGAAPGMSATHEITRQQFGASMPLCELGLAPSSNYQDLWWASPAGSESGWGVNIAHQGDRLFLAWFTYAEDGRATWFVASDLRAGADGGFKGSLYRAAGPYWAEIPFNRARVSVEAVGEATLAFSSPSEGTFTYAMAANGVRHAKPITRQVFATPTTSCR